MDKRQKKRLIIIFVYIFLVCFFTGGGYYFLRTPATCTDGILNQNEEQIDCGGVCKKCDTVSVQNLVLGKAGALRNGSENTFDLYAEITNPNQVFGSKKLEYQFSFKDASGNVILTKKGSDFILPGEKKYLTENSVRVSQEFSSIEVKILSSDWIRLFDYYERPRLRVTNKNYTELSNGTIFGETRGLLKNESTFDFSLIKVKVVLKNGAGEVITLNSTEVKTVKSGEEREFITIWPTRFPGDVKNVEVYPEVNVFDSQSFVEKYFQSQEFRSYE